MSDPIDDATADRAARALALELSDAEHPDVDTELTAYVDGTLRGDDRETVESHLATCARCREDVADLRATQEAIRPRSHRWTWIAAAAAAVILAILAVALLRKTPVSPSQPEHIEATQTTTTVPQQPAPPPDAHPEWRAGVEKAIRDGALRMPATLAALQLAPDQLRAPGGATAHLEPVSAIVESTQPRLTWTATPNATYAVTIFDREKLVAESGPLRKPEWQPKRMLLRGHTYQWQVEVRAGDDVTILPTPPAPPALFRVLDSSAHQELDAARAAHEDDPLLLGVLYAKHGLRAEAEKELRKVESTDGRKLLHSVEAWR